MPAYSCPKCSGSGVVPAFAFARSHEACDSCPKGVLRRTRVGYEGVRAASALLDFVGGLFVLTFDTAGGVTNGDADEVRTAFVRMIEDGYTRERAYVVDVTARADAEMKAQRAARRAHEDRECAAEEARERVRNETGLLDRE